MMPNKETLMPPPRGPSAPPPHDNLMTSTCVPNEGSRTLPIFDDTPRRQLQRYRRLAYQNHFNKAQRWKTISNGLCPGIEVKEGRRHFPGSYSPGLQLTSDPVGRSGKAARGVQRNTSHWSHLNRTGSWRMGGFPPESPTERVKTGKQC